MDWLAFFGSIIGGLIGGLFTFCGVKLTLKHEREKEKKEEKKRTIENKPRLEIINYLNFNKTRKSNSGNNDCNVLALKISKFEVDRGIAKFYYDKSAIDLNNLIFVEYEMINTGNTEIIEVCVTTNFHRNMALTSLENREILINKNFLNYDVCSNKRYIKPGEKIKIRIYYVNNQVVVSNIGNAAMTIWLFDINGRWWTQIFDCPNNRIEISQVSSYEMFQSSRDVDKAIECFEKPNLW